MTAIFHDLRYAIRGFVKTPGFTIAIVLTLALGIGANTALFSIFNGLLLKTLPVTDPEHLILLDGDVGTNPIWEQIRSRQNELFAGAFAWSAEAFDISEQSRTEFVDGVYASGGMFDVLGVHAVRGRTFTAADDVRGGGSSGAIAVISYGFWQRRFGGAEDVLGRRLMLNHVPFSVVGVMPPGFFGPDVGRAADIFVPLSDEALIKGQDSSLDCRSCWWLNVMARLKQGQSVEQASALLAGVHGQIREATLPDSAEGRDGYLRDAIKAMPAATGRSTLRRRYQQPLVIIMVVVGAVLLIACANVANLLLARAIARRPEMALRLALGASRFALARQLLVEGFLLAGAGAALGLFVARLGSSVVIRQLTTPNDAVFLDTSLDWRVMAFAAALATVTAVLFGLAPALGAGRLSPHTALKEQGRGVAGDRRFGLRNALVVSQVALSLVLIVAAGLFVRTFSGLMAVPLGFDPNPLIVVQINAQRSAAGATERSALFERFREASISIPEVRHAALSIIRPLSGSGWNTAIAAAGGRQLSGREQTAWVNAVSPGWFATYGIRTIAGRDFTAGDRGEGALAAIVNETFARRFFNGENAVGQEVQGRIAIAATAPYQIVGVVTDAVYRRPREGVLPTIYISLPQIQELNPVITLAVQVPPASRGRLTASVLEALGRVDGSATFTLQPYDEQIRESLTQERLVALLSGFFGALALGLAAIGLYGATSYAVNRRRTEIGVRMALGANASEVARLILSHVGWLVTSGIAIGALLSWWGSRFIAPALLFGVEARDPSTFATAAVVLIGVGILAGWLPARRATRIDPMLALRAE